MHEVAVGTFELILIVWRHVRILRLHVLGFFNQIFRVVALGTGLDRHFLRIGFIGAVAGFACHTHGDVTIGAELLVGSLRRPDGDKRRQHQGGKSSEGLHKSSPVVLMAVQSATRGEL